jgi:hypothetical protein
MSTRSEHNRSAQRILRRLKGLEAELRAGEEPLLDIPAIWDSGAQEHSIPCDVIVTNQRLIGFYSRDFPRRRVFFEYVELASVTAVTLRHKAFEPLFRELLMQAQERKIYIRAARRHIEALYAALRAASSSSSSFSERRQDVRTTFASSPLATVLLLGGGLALVVSGFILWSATQSLQPGFPLLLAGLVAMFTSMLVRRQRR